MPDPQSSNTGEASPIALDDHLNRFRVASRELLNGYFRTANPYPTGTLGWVLEARFLDVEALLFEKLVTEAVPLRSVRYGTVQPQILVVPHTDPVPWMLNREIKSGYWDGSPDAVTPEARLMFIEFFDWDQLAIRDNRYVRVQVASWQSQPGAVGKHALIETHHVRCVEA
jgi:hypothetical protein